MKRNSTNWNVEHVEKLKRFDADNNIISRSTTISSSDENSLIETVIFYVENTESTGASYRTTLTDPCN